VTSRRGKQLESFELRATLNTGIIGCVRVFPISPSLVGSTIAKLKKQAHDDIFKLFLTADFQEPNRAAFQVTCSKGENKIQTKAESSKF
jgi:hypothetical protein